MTITGIWDSKNSLYTVLRDAYRELEDLYPEKIQVKVTTAYPRTVEQIDKKALITISRVTNQEEYRFVSDAIFSQEIASNQQQSAKGALQTDIFEIAIWTLDSQYRDDLYLLTRQLLFEKKDILYRDHQFIKFYRVGGSDQELDVAKLPRTVYRAVLNYLVMTRMTYSTASELVSAIGVETIVVSGSLE